MNPIEHYCRKCDQNWKDNDDMVCDAVTSVMANTAKKKETALEAFRREGEPNGGKS